MSTASVSEVLARANSAMVASDLDVAGGLSALLAGACQALGADSAAILVRTGHGLEVLAASSHRAEDLEIHQMQEGEGPCFDSVGSGRPVALGGREAILSRWPSVGRYIVGAGYVDVSATPMGWRGEYYGALNLFSASVVEDRAARRLAERAFADTATLLIVAHHQTEGLLGRSVEHALAQRAVIERAKGALAQVRSLSMPAAFEALQGLAATEDLSLGATAALVMERARTATLR